MDGSPLERPVCFLSLILPAYQEAAGIAQAVQAADTALSRLGVTYEILVVDDGSLDATSEKVREVACALPNVRLLVHAVNRGYGAALRTGFEAAHGARIAFTDADGQFDLMDLRLLLPLAETHDVAVGFRVDRQDPALRKFYSRGYNLLARTLLGTTVRDIDCALKVFQREALTRLLPASTGFFVNTEMLARARQQGRRVAEVGVRHLARRHGTSKVSLKDIPRTLNALLPFWWAQVLFIGRAAGQSSREPGSLLGKMLALLLLVGLTASLFATRLDCPLLEPEEARYAEIPRQMLAAGHLVTPILHGEAYYQKPPLLYWLVMASYQCFGVHDWAARLVPCLAGVLTVLVTALWGWRSLGFWPGLVGATILALSARYLYLAGMLTTDGLLCLWVVAGLAAGHLALLEPRQRLRWLLLSAVACGLGILTKGPVALLLIGMPLALLGFLDRRQASWSWRQGGLYLGVAGAVAAPWFAAVTLQAPGAVGSFFWLHNLQRYVVPFDHEKPAWFYVPSLIVGVMPWTLLVVPLAPYLARRTWRAGQRRPAALGAFVLAFGWCLAFFSLSGCKRPGYILPAFPCFALILGTYLTHGMPWRRWLSAVQGLGTTQQAGHRLALRLLSVTFLGASCVGAVMAALGYWNWPQAAVVLLALGLFVFLLYRLQLSSPAWFSWAGCAAGLYVLLLIAGREWLPDYHRHFALGPQVEAQRDLEPSLPTICYPKRWDSVSFYLERDVAVYSSAHRQELMHDLQQRGRSLLFVKRAGALQDLLSALPAEMEFLPRGQQGPNVVAGIVQPREK